MSKIIWKPGTMLYPVPAVMITAQHEDKMNIITISWVGTICTNPPMVSISVRPERYSYDLIKKSGEFVINVPDKSLAFATDFCGVRSGRDVDKFNFLKLTPEPATQVKAPLIKEAPLALECKVTQTLELGSHHMFIAEVMAVHVDDHLVDEKGKLHLEKAELLAYSHGEYCTMTQILGKFGFSVERKRMAEYTAQLQGTEIKRERCEEDEKADLQRGVRKTEKNKPFGGRGGKSQNGENYFGERGRSSGENTTFGGRGGKRQESGNYFNERGRSSGGNKPFGGRSERRPDRDKPFNERSRNAGQNKDFASKGTRKHDNDDFFDERGRNARQHKTFEGKNKGRKGEGHTFSGKSHSGHKPRGKK